MPHTIKYLPLTLLLFQLSACITRPKIRTGHEGKELPSFHLMVNDSLTDFNMADISAGGPYVLISFSPSCPYCRAEIDDITSNIRHIEKVRFYLIANNATRADELKRFYDGHHLKDYSNIIAGIDTKNYFTQYFTVPAIPYLAFYDAHKKLREVLIGKVNISTITDIANGN